MDIVTINKTVESKIITVRGQKVILDSEVALLYGVETKRVNEAVSRNLEKFPNGYTIELTEDEWLPLKSQFATSMKGGKIKLPKAFTEKGLYMLATILKSPRATVTTIAIVETFAKVREATRSVAELLDTGENNPHAEKLQHKIGHFMTDILTPNIDDYDIETIKTSTKVKFLSMFEFSKEVVRKPKKKQ